MRTCASSARFVGVLPPSSRGRVVSVITALARARAVSRLASTSRRTRSRSVASYRADQDCARSRAERRADALASSECGPGSCTTCRTLARRGRGQWLYALSRHPSWPVAPDLHRLSKKRLWPPTFHWIVLEVESSLVWLATVPTRSHFAAWGTSAQRRRRVKRIEHLHRQKDPPHAFLDARRGAPVTVGRERGPPSCATVVHVLEAHQIVDIVTVAQTEAAHTSLRLPSRSAKIRPHSCLSSRSSCWLKNIRPLHQGIRRETV